MDADGVVDSAEGGEVFAFTEFGDEEKSGEALLVSFAFQQLQAVIERRRRLVLEMEAQEIKGERKREKERGRERFAYHRRIERCEADSGDKERRMSLERDTCPGFLSDGYGRVVWMNGAYRSMVGQEKETDEVTVCLVVKETASVAAVALVYPAFTCRVRVQYTCGSLTLPCDVWRMEGGGFAWRLDVKAALCLGRPAVE